MGIVVDLQEYAYDRPRRKHGPRVESMLWLRTWREEMNKAQAHHNPAIVSMLEQLREENAKAQAHHR